MLAVLALFPPLSPAQSTGTLGAFGALRPSLGPQHVAIVVNADDPASVEVGGYYRARRGVPAENLIAVNVPAKARLTRDEFAALQDAIVSRIPSATQVLVLVWTTPYAVECNGITAALTLGFDAELCAHSCGPAKVSPYFDSASLRPYDDLGIRPAMLLPVASVAQAKALIDRGVASDGRARPGAAYLLTTADAARSSRARYFPKSMTLARPPLRIVNLRADAIENRADVMFYLTGAADVPHLDTLRFLPGALADHLTSFGGELVGGSQMSSLRWLEAGATASYGTVSEPCNYPQKFPHAGVLIKHYLAGATAVEAYWKSVAWPAQGVVIGEPLAAPYRRPPG